MISLNFDAAFSTDLGNEGEECGRGDPVQTEFIDGEIREKDHVTVADLKVKVVEVQHCKLSLYPCCDARLRRTNQTDSKPIPIWYAHSICQIPKSKENARGLEPCAINKAE